MEIVILAVLAGLAGTAIAMVQDPIEK